MNLDITKGRFDHLPTACTLISKHIHLIQGKTSIEQFQFGRDGRKTDFVACEKQRLRPAWASWPLLFTIG